MPSEAPPPAEEQPALRSDAVRNRQKVLEVAAELFAEAGLDVSYDEIARQAGIGVGTVYRRFPDRKVLIEALFDAKLREILRLAESATELTSAWAGLTQFLNDVIRLQVVDRGLNELVAFMPDDDSPLVDVQRQISGTLGELVARAKAEGSLRADATLADFGIILMLLSSVRSPVVPELWQRYLTVFLDGMRAEPQVTPLPCDAPDDQVTHAMMIDFHRR